MATIRKRCWKTPSGVAKSAWIVSYSVGGKRHIKTFTLKKAAETWRAQTLTEIAHGTHARVDLDHRRQGRRVMAGAVPH